MDNDEGLLVAELFVPRNTVGELRISIWSDSVDAAGCIPLIPESGRSLIELGSEIDIKTNSTRRGTFPG
jgi:hypothetical protein